MLAVGGVSWGASRASKGKALSCLLTRVGGLLAVGGVDQVGGVNLE